MVITCEVHGCGTDAQGALTTSGYSLCVEHFEQWQSQNMFVVEEDGKVILKGAPA